ncbi:MAG: biotin--[Clostridia bacterium]|nr:biotin--[acetyl-CoA-carboxylase] ligase [Clostridia bacterium]
MINASSLKTLRFETLASTQEYCKEKRGEKENLFVVAKSQPMGKGTKGRSFSSEKGGLYLSMLLYPENFLAENAFLVMARSAVAVCKTLEGLGISPTIKWPNDIHVRGKKICGILIENQLQGKFLSSLIVGVGLNINNPLPPELSSIATSVCLELGEEVDILEVEEGFRTAFFSPFSFVEYTARLGYLGEKVTLAFEGKTEEATLLSVNERGGLIAYMGGEKREFYAGEVTLRGWKA